MPPNGVVFLGLGSKTRYNILCISIVGLFELSLAPTYTYSIIVRGLLLSVFIFSFIWAAGLFRSDMLYIFTWFCPCFQCKDSSAYPHLPYRDSDMIFQILCLLSHGHALRVAVFNWQAFEFEPIRIAITTSMRLVALFCIAYTLLKRPNQVETAVQSLHFWLSVWTLSCRCHVKFFIST